MKIKFIKIIKYIRLDWSENKKTVKVWNEGKIKNSSGILPLKYNNNNGDKLYRFVWNNRKKNIRLDSS